MTGDPVPVPVETAPGTFHNGDEVAVILMVTGMIEYRNRMIATFLDRFEQSSDRLHQERRARGFKKHSEELIRVADRIHMLAQDNAYDIRNLMVRIDRQQELGDSAGGNTGHHGQVCYIQ